VRILISAASELFTDAKPHGEGLICYEIVSRLAKRGHALHVFAPEFSLEKELPNTRIYHIRNRAFAPSLNPWKYQRESRIALKRFLGRGGIDIIHHMMPFYPETHFSWLQGCPLVIGPLFLPWSLSDNEIEDIGSKRNFAKKPVKALLRRISSRMYHRTIMRAGRILITVDKLRDGLPLSIQGKLQTVPFGVDTQRFVPADVKPTKPTILFLANLLKRKGLQYLLQAMPEIITTLPKAQLIVVGGGASESHFRSLARELKILPHVKFAGPVSHNEAADWFQQCDVYCLPSIAEPFGVSILEAMSCGKPVVATMAGGIPSFVKDGESGYLVPARDSHAIAEAIIKILREPVLAAGMGKYNRELCVRNYDWDIVVDMIEKVYEEVLS